MPRARRNIIPFAAYLAGGVLLTLAGPGLWNVHPMVACIAASATTLCFMAVHMLIDTRAIAHQAIELGHRRRTELVALGKYVARIEQRLASTATIDATSPAQAVHHSEEAPAPQVASNLLQFAARVNARCASGEVVPAETDAAMQKIVTEAITEARVDLHLQPIVKLPSRQTVHYEALSRIRDSSGNVILPARFLPAAAAAGIAADLETHQLAAVISLCNRIGGKHPGTRIFCNLSVHALQSDRFREELTTFMESHTELASRLVFEMNGKAAALLHTEAVADIRALEDLGFAFSVESTSLAELGRIFGAFGRLAFAKIEADALIGADPNVITSLAKGGTQVIATRIETERQALEMIEIGIGHGQGYLFGQPRPARMDAERQRRAA